MAKPTLKFGASGADVLLLQQQLNCLSPTRLPRLSGSSNFDILTMARVMEFQHVKGLKADGICGPNTNGAIGKTPTTCPKATAPKGMAIVVDLINNKLFAFRDGTAELTFDPIHGGSTSDPSTRGVFQMSSRRLRSHTSSQFPIPPGNMDFSLFYHRGEALHQGPPTLESHGCIHVGVPDAENLFDWAAANNIIVIVVKLTP